MITNLEIKVENTNSCKTLQIIDKSVYNPDIPTENGILEITPPGYDCAVIFEVDAAFNIILTSSSLKLSSFSSTAHLMTLPEGIYHIKYSIKPNSYLYVEYDYLRNCGQINEYIKAVCKAFDNECKHCDIDFKEAIIKLSWIRQLIAAAKYKVEECNEPDRGLDLYNEAKDLLRKFNKC